MRIQPQSTVLAITTVLWFMNGAVAAAQCQVPTSTHPTIQTAIEDLGCNEILLSAGAYGESPTLERDLTISGAGSGSTAIYGSVEILGCTVELRGVLVSGPADTLLCRSNAEVEAFDLVVAHGPADAFIFADGFELGNSTAWSLAVP